MPFSRISAIKEDVNDGFRSGLRASARIAPTANLTITPRIVYQRVKMDGWNRFDEFNILANPYTTTRPAVTLGEREQFTQLHEDFTDDFVLGDVNVNYQFAQFRPHVRHVVHHRDVLVVRDAGALTSSITGGTIGLPENVYTLDAPFNDATTADVWTQELRVAGGKDRFPWLAGVFYSHTDRDYGQDLPVLGFQELTEIPTRGSALRRTRCSFPISSYNLNQFALFGEGTFSLTPRFSVTGGLRYYHFSEHKEQIFDGIFGKTTRHVAGVAAGSTDANGVAPRVIATYKLSDNTNLDAQVSKGFRLGGREPATWTLVDDEGHAADASGTGQTLRLSTDMSIGIEGSSARARHVLSKGERAFCALSWADGLASPTDVDDAAARIETTVRFWRNWLARARIPDHGLRHPLERSALTIKGLTYMPTGATVAALTTSLPETPGGERNWDYRYTWMRDTTFTLQALHFLNLDWEADEFMQFVADVEPNEDGGLQIMYGIDGRRDLTETTRDELSGYEGARPVRIGNGAFDQRQNDVYGAVLDSLLLHTRRSKRLPRRLWPLVESQAECASRPGGSRTRGSGRPAERPSTMCRRS